MTNNRVFGYLRDNFIAETVDKFKCLDSKQIELLFFENCNEESAKRKSKSVLRRIVEKHKLLKRWRMDLDESYKYFSKDFDQKEHIVLLNWMLIDYLIKQPYERIYHMDYQRDFGIKIPDLFLITYNQYNIEQPYKSIFFEMDKTITNKFDAVEKYNKLCDSRPEDKEHFPKIIIATTDINRLQAINQLINNPQLNKNNLRFDTHLIWNLMEVCKHAKVKDFRSKFITNTTTVSGSLC